MDYRTPETEATMFGMTARDFAWLFAGIVIGFVVIVVWGTALDY